MKVSRKYLGFCLVLALLLALSIGVTHAQEPKVLHTGVHFVSGDPETLDPQLAQAVTSIQVIEELFVGVTILDEVTTEVQPGIATSWDISEDGLVYTFHLMEGVPWVRYNADTGTVEQLMDESGNPRVVTANDFVYGILRSLDPATADPYSYVLAPYIVGGVEFNGGTGAAEDVGVAALDDNTLGITAPEAVGFAVNIYGMWMGRAVPQFAIEEFGDAWTEPENIASYGPFALKEWAHDESLTLIKNPLWPGTDVIPQPTLDEVVIHFLDDTVQFTEYQAGTLDAISVPAAEIPRIQSDAVLSEEYFVGTSLCTYYYGFNTLKAPFDNANIRRAFSLAVDRQAIVDNVTQGGQIPARWFARPGLAAAPTPETHPDLGIGLDSEAAQQALAAGLEEMGVASVDELPAITLGYNDTTTHANIAQAIQQMWADTLGITVQLTAFESTTYFTMLQEDAPQIFRSGWCNDYPDANNFLYDVFRSDSTQNDPNYENPAYDALIDEARLLTDQEERRELYAQAEEILVDEGAAIAPIYWYVENQLTKPYVTRTFSVIALERYEKWDVGEH